jgi:heme exporter protein A
LKQKDHFLTNTGQIESAPMQNDDTPIFEVRGLECVRHDIILFQDISFSLQAGDLYQVDGENGTGKTSIIRILAGLIQPTAGEVLWRGKEISECLYDYQCEFTYIGHLSGIKDALTPVENLKVVEALTGTEKNDLSRILERVGLLGLDDIPVNSLSAGQKRRVALARLIITNTSLWLLDEPFTSLDPAGKILIEQMIVDHCAAGGIVIFATHQPMEIKGCAINHIHLGKK